MTSLRKREERLVRLFGYDEVDGDVVRSELCHVQGQRELLASKMDALTGVGSALGADIDERELRRTCGAITELLDGAAPDRRIRTLSWRPFSYRSRQLVMK